MCKNRMIMFCFLTMVSFVLFLCCNKKKTNDYPDITENNSKKTVCDEINIIRDTVILKDSISKKIINIPDYYDFQSEVDFYKEYEECSDSTKKKRGK